MTSQHSTEHWNLYLDRDYQAMPWPWPGTSWEELTAAQVEALPHAVEDFTRYSPSDGPTDMAQVPNGMPREAPVAITRLAVYHDTEHIYIFIDAVRPAQPIPQLVDLVNEDFSCVIPLNGEARGLYFGMNERGEAIGCVQIWDPDIQPEGAENDWPFSLLTDNPGAGPSASRAGILRDGYRARCLATDHGYVGCLQIDKRLIAGGMRDNSFSFSAGRCCYATIELLCWGSPIIWSPRPDQHGRIELVTARRESHLPQLYRLDMHYHPHEERGELVAAWRAGVTPDALAQLATGQYAGYLGKTTVALNGIEATLDMAPTTRATFPIPDGWNRLEVLTATAPPAVVNFQKVSGRRPIPSRALVAATPELGELNEAFRAWHQAHEQNYRGQGTWGNPTTSAHCLCHDGIFHLLPYLFACRHLEHLPVYEERIRETCTRMLANQHRDGWFPCYCSSVNHPGYVPKLGEGGAFTNGSVGEGIALASVLLDEPRWLEASLRAADYRWYRWEQNQNYAAFALWHLAALQEIVPRDEWIDKAVYLAQFVTRDIGLSGAQDGHNYYTGYGNITLKGMARLLRVLPAEHPYYPTLRDKTIRFTNQTLARQQPSGLFAGRNRKYLGYHHLAPGLFAVADALPELVTGLIPALVAMTRSVIETRHCSAEHRDVDCEAGLTLALMGQCLLKPQLALLNTDK